MPRQKSTHVDSPAAVGERLKAAREKAGLSQRQLSFLGCSPAYISRIESGDRIPSLQLLRELGRRLSVSEDYLATGSEFSGDRGGMLVEAEVALRLNELEEAEHLFSRMLERAPNDTLHAEGLAGLGHIAFRRGEPRTAIPYFEQALSIFGPLEASHPDLADSLGRSYAMVGELESAIGIFERYRDSATQRDDAFQTIQFSVLLAHALIDSGNLGRAEELLGGALALGRGFESPSVRAQLYWSQSRLHAERGDPVTAARFARSALEILRLTEDTYRTARAHQLLAHLELDRGNPQEALDLLEEGWPLLEVSANKLERAQYRLEEARALARLGRSEEAAALAMQISGLIADAHPEDAARSYSVLAGVFDDLGDRGRAKELYELAEELLEPRTPNRFLIDVYSRLADIAESEGRKEEAYELMKKAVGMQKAVAEVTTS
ncbi:MAG TPA: tetratricopeptide repeat protein [Gaiellaceae bacterium]|jgi:tetratricopeptide (TPR) repeat protein|nr:tetratricopeptide repeat protein [Gaiellaceae bacterium]